mgnify:CR=1
MVMIVDLDVFPENAVISYAYRVQAVKGTARIEKRTVTDTHRAAPPYLNYKVFAEPQMRTV